MVQAICLNVHEAVCPVDVLSDVLENLRLRSHVLAETELSPPWGIRANPTDDFAFHIVSRGQLLVAVYGRAPVEVTSGDVLLLAPGRGHTLRDDPASAAPTIQELVASGAFTRPPAVDPIATNAPIRTTRLVCGRFRVDELGGRVLRLALPAVIHTRDLTDDLGPWIAQTSTCSRTRPADRHRQGHGRQPSVRGALRLSVAQPPTQRVAPDGELAPRSRRSAGRPRARAHSPASRAPWTVASLAAAAGMSRSAFAARFGAVVGRPPMTYLAGWRLSRAAAVLRREDIAIAEVAARHGTSPRPPSARPSSARSARPPAPTVAPPAPPPPAPDPDRSGLHAIPSEKREKSVRHPEPFPAEGMPDVQRAATPTSREARKRVGRKASIPAR